jgi:hypothetical protein
MNRWFRLALVFTVLAVSLNGHTQKKPAPELSADAAQNPFPAFQSFSATLHGGIGNDHDRKIYRSGMMMRVDFDDHYRLVDLEKLTTRSVHPDRCQQFPRPDAASYPFSSYRGFKVKRAPTEDKETVDGHSCKIENVTFTPRDDRPVTIKMKIWEAEDLRGFPIKIDVDASNGNKFTLNYTNVSLKPPDPALFRNPATCTVMAGPSRKAVDKATTTPSKNAAKPPQKPPQ